MNRKKPREHKRILKSRKFTKKRGQTITVNKGIKKPFKPMPKYFHLPLETVIYVPSTRFNRKISSFRFNERINETRKILSKFFGGYTSVQAVGGYLSESKKLIEEDVVRVVGFSQRKSFLRNREKLKNWLLKKKKEWNQESIGFEFEGDLFYI